MTGKPLAVALHANVGLMHATMSIFNAWCDRLPMLVLGATGPVDAAKPPPVHRLDPHVCGTRVRSCAATRSGTTSPHRSRLRKKSLLRAMQLSRTGTAGTGLHRSRC